MSKDGLFFENPLNRPQSLQGAPSGQNQQAEQKMRGVAPPRSVPGYEKLDAVLSQAYTQAARGKGALRHACIEGERFENQVILEGARRFGRGALLFQAYKKAEESQRRPYQGARAELLGAIVYLAAAVIRLDEEAAGQDRSAGEIGAGRAIGEEFPPITGYGGAS